jgi:hypothetical protein
MKAKAVRPNGAAFDDEYTGVMTGQENDTVPMLKDMAEMRI